MQQKNFCFFYDVFYFLPACENLSRMTSFDHFLYKMQLHVLFNPDKNGNFPRSKRSSCEHDAWVLRNSHVCLSNFTRLFCQKHSSVWQIFRWKLGIKPVIFVPFVSFFTDSTFVISLISGNSEMFEIWRIFSP